MDEVKLLWLTAKNLETQSVILRKRAQLVKRRMELHRMKASSLFCLLFAQEVVRRTLWTKLKTTTFWEHEVPNYTDFEFKNSFRVTRTTFAFIVNFLNCMQRNDTNYKKAIPLEKRIAIALYAIGSSSEYRIVGSLFGVSRSIVGETVIEFCEVIWHKFQQQFLNTFPPTQETLEKILQGFENKWDFPQCFGALDGLHIKIQPPNEFILDYYNSKGWHSIVLLACADYRYRFTYINVGASGRNNNSSIYEQSLLKKQIEENEIFLRNSTDIAGISVPVLLLGDSTFQMSPHLVKPYPFSLKLSEKQILFNERLSRSRCVIENTFEHLKARFRKIEKGFKTTIDNARKIIKACCVLHNMCNNLNDSIDQRWLDEINSEKMNRNQPTIKTTSGDNNLDAKAIRDALCNHFNTQMDGE